METQFIKLNMTPTGINPCFHVSQYDIGRSLGFIVYNGSEVVGLDGYTCTVEATRSDGVAITTSVASEDNVGTFETTATMTNKADKYRCQLVIIDANSKRIASLPFDMEVIKAAMDENSESIEEDASLYQQYTEAVQGAIAEANADIQAEENARIAAVSAEATARANADTTLQNNIDAEAATRANAITAEATARQTADNTLQGNIDSEASARQAADNTLQSNINAEASTRATQDASLQSQINQLVAPSGEAPSAAEVQNARIGADGTVYSTLGDAIRDQVTDLKSDLGIVENEVLLEYTLANDLTINGYIKSDGNIITQSSDDWKVSDYVLIPEICSGVYVKKCYPLSSTNLNIAFYDSSQTYIANSGQQLNIETGISGSQSPKTITIPEGAKYVRFGTHKQASDYHGFDAILLMDDAIEYIFSKTDQALSGMSAISTELGTTDFSLADDLNNIGYIDSNGVVQYSADWRVSNLIKLQESCTGVYVTKCYPLGGSNLNIAFYDSEKAFISGNNLNVGTGAGSYTAPTTIAKPSTAKYIRMGTHKAVEGTPYYVFNASFVYADVIEDIYKEIDNVRTSPKRQLICDVIAPLVSGAKNYHVKLIGDSITAGVGGTGYDASSTGGGDWIYQGYYSNVAGYCWANLLKSYWESKLNCTVYNYGMSGRKSGHLVKGIGSWLHNDDDIVICMIGTNDRNLNETDPITGEASTQTTFYNNLKTIVEDVQSAEKKIILMSNIPAYNENNPNFDMADVDHVVMKVATEYNMEYVSVYDLMMEYCKYTGTSLNSLLVDGLHPNDSGYLVMFRLITQALCVSPEREDFGN